jgi:membrane protein required for colicin V production
MLVLFLSTSLLVWTLFRFVRAFIDRVKLKEFDHQIGALLGAAKGVLLCIIITLFTVALANESQRKSVMGSRSGCYIAHLLNRAHGIIPQEIHDVLHPYFESLEDSLDHEHNPHGEAS